MQEFEIKSSNLGKKEKDLMAIEEKLRVRESVSLHYLDIRMNFFNLFLKIKVRLAVQYRLGLCDLEAEVPL